MRKIIIRCTLFLCYCIPFVFLAMQEDATVGTLWFYLIMIAGFSSLCYGCIKTGNCSIVFGGNIASFLSSCIFALAFSTDNWEYYFKPFLPNQLIVIETVVAFLMQAIFVVCNVRDQRREDVE